MPLPNAPAFGGPWPILSAGDPYFGWRGLLTGPVETHELPGDHEGIFREPQVQALAAGSCGRAWKTRRGRAISLAVVPVLQRASRDLASEPRLATSSNSRFRGHASRFSRIRWIL